MLFFTKQIKVWKEDLLRFRAASTDSRLINFSHTIGPEIIDFSMHLMLLLREGRTIVLPCRATLNSLWRLICEHHLIFLQDL